jgi:hypothetical protein
MSLFEIISDTQPNLVVKWSQQPELQNLWGFDVPSSVNVVAADDWMCMSGSPVTDIHWWGSYLSDDVDLDAFRITIFSDIPAGGAAAPIPSHPGGRLIQYIFDLGDTHETPYGTDFFEETVNQYFVVLPEPFIQQQGTIYWLSIEAIDLDATTPTWGWHTAVMNTSPSHLDDAVQLLGYNPETGTYQSFIPLEYEPAGAPGFSLDLAFELTTIPEPATIIMIGSALVGIAAVARRKFFAR